MGNHARGPWTVNPDMRDGMEQNFHIESPDGTVAFCSVGWPDDSIAESNAHLIAAAPELLDAVAAAERLIDPTKRDYDEDLVQIWRQCQSAIAKAKADHPD